MHLHELIWSQKHYIYRPYFILSKLW